MIYKSFEAETCKGDLFLLIKTSTSTFIKIWHFLGGKTCETRVFPFLPACVSPNHKTHKLSLHDEHNFSVAVLRQFRNYIIIYSVLCGALAFLL